MLRGTCGALASPLKKKKEKLRGGPAAVRCGVLAGRCGDAGGGCLVFRCLDVLRVADFFG